MALLLELFVEVVWSVDLFNPQLFDRITAALAYVALPLLPVVKGLEFALGVALIPVAGVAALLFYGWLPILLLLILGALLRR